MLQPAATGGTGNGRDLAVPNGSDDGRAGNDTVRGGGGADYVAGRTGDDDLSGGGGNDRIRGQEDDDDLAGGSGDDRLNGGEGTNEYDGGRGDDRIDARNGVAEDVRCGPGEDTAILDNRDDPSGCEKVRRP